MPSINLQKEAQWAAGTFVICTMVAAVICVPFAHSPFAAEPTREGPWILNDLPAAQAEARKSGKPIFVVFRCER